MKKAITIICLSLSALIILDSFNAAEALTMFLLSGQIPGTSVFVSAKVMLEACALIGGFVLSRVMFHAIRAARASFFTSAKA